MPVIDTELTANRVIVSTNQTLNAKDKCDHDDSDPRSVRKLRDENDGEDKTRHHKTDNIDRPRAQNFTALSPILRQSKTLIPMSDHSQL